MTIIIQKLLSGFVLISTILLIPCQSLSQKMDLIEKKGGDPMLLWEHNGHFYFMIRQGWDHYLGKVDASLNVVYCKPIPKKGSGQNTERIIPCLLDDRILFEIDVYDKRTNTSDIFLHSYSSEMEPMGPPRKMLTIEGKASSWHRVFTVMDNSLISKIEDRSKAYKFTSYDNELNILKENTYALPAGMEADQLWGPFVQDDGSYYYQSRTDLGRNIHFFDRDGSNWTRSLSVDGLVEVSCRMDYEGNGTFSVLGSYRKVDDPSPIIVHGILNEKDLNLNKLAVAPFLPNSTLQASKKWNKEGFEYHVQQLKTNSDGSKLLVLNGSAMREGTGSSGGRSYATLGYMKKDIIVMKLSSQHEPVWTAVIPRFIVTPYGEYSEFLVQEYQGKVHVIFNDDEENIKKKAGDAFDKVKDDYPRPVHAIIDENGKVKYSMIPIKQLMPIGQCDLVADGFYFVAGNRLSPACKIGKYTFQ